MVLVAGTLSERISAVPQLCAAGASEELIADLAMTLARHADRSAVVTPFPTGRERAARRARR